MVQDRAGIDMFEYFFMTSRHVDARNKDIIRVGMKVIKLLERLHSLGIVHGDIQPGNVLFDEYDESGSYSILFDDLVLSDFGMAKFFPPEVGTSTMVSEIPRGLSPILMSPWQLEMNRVGRRDDVFRSAEMMVSLLLREYHGELSEERAKGMPALISAKKNLPERAFACFPDNPVAAASFREFLKRAVEIPHPDSDIY
jgi:serine/threonine protein kinase